MLLANRNYNLFDEMFKDPFFTRSFENSSTQIMKTDIHDKDGNYIIEMELPGYAKEDIKADLKDGYLTITASKNETKEERMPRATVSVRNDTPAHAIEAFMWENR